MAQLSLYRRMRFAAARLMEQGGTSIASRAVDLTLMALIMLSVLAIVLESVESIRQDHEAFFLQLELIAVAVFSVETLLRLWSAADDPRYARGNGASRARLRYLFSPLALIDIAAVLPFYLAYFGVVGDGSLLVLRSVRLLRILKLTRYSASFTVLMNVIRENARGLAAAFFLLNVVMLLAACGIYLFERQAQPVAFGSIPAAMWWAFATLTTVGYGDVTPITAAGRVFGASITVVGVGMVALPTAILASAFSERLRIRAQRYQRELSAALDDGILTQDERAQLKALREKLSLGDELADELADAMTDERGASTQPLQELPAVPGVAMIRANSSHAAQHRCPHCNGPLTDEATAGPATKTTHGQQRA
jgi:voltage-gated potassium channel